tara:strand:+ start:130 stop:267 length:138 start_codon:yes stop_codon:yes gene_type:complete
MLVPVAEVVAEVVAEGDGGASAKVWQRAAAWRRFDATMRGRAGTG